MEQDNITKYICIFYKDFKSYCEERLKPYKLTNGLYYYVIFIYKKPVSRLNEITKGLKVDKAHTTRTIQKLIEFGYVTKEVNENDRKAFNIYPTEKCNEIMEEMVNLFSEWEDSVLKGYSKEESEVLAGLLRKGIENIEIRGYENV